MLYQEENAIIHNYLCYILSFMISTFGEYIDCKFRTNIITMYVNYLKDDIHNFLMFQFLIMNKFVTFL